MDLAALRAELLRRGFDGLDTSGTTRQDMILNRAMHWICDAENWPFLYATRTGTAPLAITDLRTIESVVNTTQKRKLAPLDRRHLTDMDTDLTTTGSPSYFYTSAVGTEVQTLTIDAAGGTFTATFAGETTTATAFDATALTLQTNLIALANLETGDVTVSGAAGGPYTITFAGSYENVDVPILTTNAGSLTGGAQTATVAVTTAGYYVNVYPANTTDTLQVRYWRTPPDLSATADVPAIPPRWHVAIVDVATIYAYEQTDNREGADMARFTRDEILTQMRNALLSQQVSGPDDFIVVTAGSADW